MHDLTVDLGGLLVTDEEFEATLWPLQWWQGAWELTWDDILDGLARE